MYILVYTCIYLYILVKDCLFLLCVIPCMLLQVPSLVTGNYQSHTGKYWYILVCYLLYVVAGSPVTGNYQSTKQKGKVTTALHCITYITALS